MDALVLSILTDNAMEQFMESPSVENYLRYCAYRDAVSLSEVVA